MKLYINILIFIFILTNCIAQSDFRNGYIINNSGDTVYGQINYKGNRSNAKECIFIKNGSTEHIKYAPADLRGYRFIDSKYFVTRKIKKEISGKSGTIEELLFLEYLIHGEVDIFYYRDDAGEHYFIDNEAKQLTELRNDEKEIYINNVKSIRESKQYIGVLKYFFAASPEVINEAEHTSLDHKSLIKIAKDYHEAVCKSDQCIIYEKKKLTVQFNYGPVIGIHLYYLHLPFVAPMSLEIVNLKGATSRFYPSLGIFCKLSLPTLSEKLFFQYQIVYSKRELSSNTIYDNYNFESDIQQSSIENEGIIRYEFPIGKIGPVIEAGIFTDELIRNDASYKEYVVSESGASTFVGENNNNSLSRFDYGLVVGAGGIYKINKKNSISLDIKYLMGKGFDQDVVYLPNNTFINSSHLNSTRNFSINLSYIF